jgi:thiamine kinase-like enzyme
MNSAMTEPRVSELLRQIPVLASATRVTPLGGLTNRNYRIDTSLSRYVMRVSSPETSLLGINRNNERINTERACRAGVGASIVHALPQENVLVMSWIEARTLHAENLREEPELLPRIANSLRMLHTGPKFEGEFYFPTVRKNYLNTVQKAGYFIPADYLVMEPLVRGLEEILTSTAEPMVPCNNDLLAENFMDDGNKIWIIDFEYAGQNEASFEIGNLASESFLTEEQLTSLCDNYWGGHNPSKIARAKAWSMIARYGWVLWASIQEAISPIDFDFRGWGMKKWNSVLPELTGSQYQNILESLKKDS